MEPLLRESAYIVTIVSGIVAAGLFAVRARKRSIQELRESIAPAWTNEGDFSSNESIFVTLDLLLEDGDVCGTLRANTEEQLLDAHGSVGWGSAVLQVSRLMRIA